MVESRWSIPTPDGKIIHGVINKSGKNKKAVLHIHGLTGNPYEVAPTAMATTFPSQGYDVIRPYLYASDHDARNLVDCTIHIHGTDIDTIIDHFQTEYDDIFATGHSYGGSSLMCSNCNNFKALCLWDPTYDPSVTNTDLTPLGDYYVMKWGSDILMGQAMYDEKKTFTQDYSRSLSAKCKTPLRVVTAANGFWVKFDESFHSHASGPADRIIINGSKHCFYEEGTTEPLLKATKEWFDRFANT